MSNKVNNLPLFIEAVEKEFAIEHPNFERHMFKILLGERIVDIKKDRIDEQEYIKNWLNIKP